MRLLVEGGVRDLAGERDRLGLRARGPLSLIHCHLSMDGRPVSHEPSDQSTAELFERVYGELKALAGSYLRSERRDHTLQPTALVHEAYLRLANISPGVWSDRRKFVAVASRAMRRILVDHARARRADKRRGEKVTLDPGVMAAHEVAVDVVLLDEALAQLAEQDEQRGRIVELHFFGGLTVEETAAVLELSERTVYRQLRSAKAWLKLELAGDSGPAPA